MVATLITKAVDQVVPVFVKPATQIVGHAGDEVGAVAGILYRSEQQAPRLRIAIDDANRNASLGMTGF
jgi:hypothetical protein